MQWEESQKEIAEQVGLNQSQASRFANRDDIRILIEQEQENLLDVVPDAVQNIKDLVREMPDIPKSDTKRRELSYKASKDVLKSVGLLPTPIQSQTFINHGNSDNFDILYSAGQSSVIGRLSSHNYFLYAGYWFILTGAEADYHISGSSYNYPEIDLGQVYHWMLRSHH